MGPTATTKVVSPDALEAVLRRARRRKETIVFTNGCFDLLHWGHVRSLEEAAQFGDRLIVAVNRDASVRRSKGDARPIIPARDRMRLVAALHCVDWVIGFGQDTPRLLIERIRPDILAKGGDWKRSEIVGGDFVESYGGRVVRLRRAANQSTTDVIGRIRP